MFEGFTQDARQAVVVAQGEARALGHGAVGPEHLLLGLLRSEDAPAARALGALGLSGERAREDVERITGRGTHTSHGQMPSTPRTMRVLERAGREAMSLGHDDVTTEHVLLALLAERDGVAGQVLGTVADPGVVRDAVLRAMSEPLPDSSQAGPAVDLPNAVSVRVSDEVHRLLRRAAGQALAEDAAELGVEHVRRALGDAADP